MKPLITSGFASGYRLMLLSAGVLAGFGVIGIRLVHLQVWARDSLIQHVEKARRQVLVDRARRGDIMDSSGNILATSRSLVELGADPHMLRPGDRARWPELARLCGMSVSSLSQILDPAPAAEGPAGRSLRWVKISDAVEESAYAEILKLGIKGVYGNRTYRRVYPGGALAAHILGYINREDAAVTGVEHYMDFYLRGHDGWRESEKDGHRRELAQFRSREVRPSDGYHVMLSIDSVVQHIIEEELDALSAKFHPQSATIIVSDPRTGYILGLANTPSYDPNAYGTASIASQKNLAITNLIEPGSTFKIVAASAALNERLVTPQSTFDCGARTINYRGRLRPLPRDSHEHGRLSVADIVARSSNIGAAHLGAVLGEERLYRYASSFGFGEATGFPFGGEINGILQPVDKWDGLTITRLPMGHAVGATPMQIHCAMGAIANDGVLLQPQIIREVLDDAGDPVFMTQSKERNRVISTETAELMSRLLTRVASREGTAPQAEIPGFEVAGKTGTTQKIIDGAYSSTHHVASFVGFFPASRPELLITVIVDDARIPGGGTAYGSVVSAPAFRHVAEQLIQYFGINPVSAPGAHALAWDKRTP